MRTSMRRSMPKYDYKNGHWIECGRSSRAASERVEPRRRGRSQRWVQGIPNKSGLRYPTYLPLRSSMSLSGDIRNVARSHLPGARQPRRRGLVAGKACLRGCVVSCGRSGFSGWSGLPKSTSWKVGMSADLHVGRAGSCQVRSCGESVPRHPGAAVGQARAAARLPRRTSSPGRSSSAARQQGGRSSSAARRQGGKAARRQVKFGGKAARRQRGKAARRQRGNAGRLGTLNRR